MATSAAGGHALLSFWRQLGGSRRHGVTPPSFLGPPTPRPLASRAAAPGGRIIPPTSLLGTSPIGAVLHQAKNEKILPWEWASGDGFRRARQ